MRITVFGAAGSIGSRITAEALARGHQVRAVVRNQARFPELPPAAEARAGDANDVADAVALSAGQDVLVGATRPLPPHEHDLVTTAKALLEGARRNGVRLLLVGGAATLTVPGGAGSTVLDDPRYLSPDYRAIALACRDQLAACRSADDVDWVYLSPPASLVPGQRTGTFRRGTDELLVDAVGHSTITIEDLAVAALDEIERPAHHRRQFTVAY